LDKVREDLAGRLSREGFRPFRFEDFRKQSEWRRHTPAQNEGTCLEEIDRSDFVVCIFSTTYGSSARDHLAGIALTDLEFFQAFKGGKPIRVYLLDYANPAPELGALVEIIRVILPDAVVSVATPRELSDRVIADLQHHYQRRHRFALRSEHRRFMVFCERTIQRRLVLDDELTGLRFLRDQFPAAARAFDAAKVGEELKTAQQLRPHDVRLAALWDILTDLFAVPWQTEHRSLALWDQCLSAWNKSAAWYGQHGFQYAGALAADNTLVAIRALRAGNGEAMTLAEILRRGDRIAGEPVGWIRLYETGGALGSEYFSISKLSPARWREHFLWKADAWCAVGERVDAIETQAGLEPDLGGRSGRASIRGQVRLALGDSTGGIRMLQDSLRWRIEARLSPDSIGWAEVALGHALYMNGDRPTGERMLDVGLQALEQSGSPGFVVRAKKRVAQVRLKQWRLREAARQLDEAWEISHKHHLRDQIADLERLVPRAIRLLVGRSAHRDREVKQKSISKN